MLKRILFKIIGGFLAFWGFAFLGAGVIVLTDGDVQQGKNSTAIIALVTGLVLGLGAWKSFRKSRKLQDQPIEIQPVENEVTDAPVSEPVTRPDPVPVPRPVPVSAPAPTPTVRRQEVPRQVSNSMRASYTGQQAINDMRIINESSGARKCNCDGCLKQEDCEYGHVVNDEITNERLSLAEKFMMVGVLDFDESLNDFGVVATNEQVHNLRLLLKLDKDVLFNTLNYLQEMKKKYFDFGKCGRAYFNFMKMGDEISLVKEAVRQYDGYQVILKQKESVKLYVLDKVNKEGSFEQEEIYKIFPNVERRNVTNAVREMEKEGIIISEKCEKTYIIHKN